MYQLPTLTKNRTISKKIPLHSVLPLYSMTSAKNWNGTKLKKHFPFHSAHSFFRKTAYAQYQQHIVVMKLALLITS